MTTHTIGKLGEFPEGRGTQVNVDGIEIAVFNVDGELFGIQNRCPHKRLPLHLAGHPRHGSATGRDCEPLSRGNVDPDGSTIECPWHHLEWDLETGYNPVKRVSIPTYDVDVIDDEVRIEI